MAEHAGATHERSIVVAANALAAQQWEMHLAAAPIAAGAHAWDTPPVRPYAAWLDELWLEHADARGPALTPHQSLALWRRVIAESTESADLIGHTGVAEWAASAWQLLNRWQLDPAAQRASGNQLDYRAFLGWCREYRARLADHAWIDRAEVEAALLGCRIRAESVVLADLTERYPSRAKLLAHLAANGTTVSDLLPPTVAGPRRAARLADATDELRAALAWAARRLAAEPRARVAVVVPAAAGRADEIARLAAAELGAGGAQPYWTEGRALGAEPVIGAALDALRLAGAHAPYATFGRWLRSPLFDGPAEENLARARLDAELRAELRSQLPFHAAYRCGVRELLAQRAPLAGRALSAAFAVVGGLRRATPSRWAHVWMRYLAELGWRPPPARSALLGWQSALDELARLTPIVGEISLDHALAELGRLLERPTSAPLPLHGVHVLDRIDDVGPGYDSVWVTGLTDTAWPEPAHGNPLLPIALQREHGMPYSSPADAHERSERALERLILRTRDLVASWPGRVHDYDTEPSPAIRPWAAFAADELDALTRSRPMRIAARETVADNAAPFVGPRVLGGTAALGRQARCPLRAFCQDRLHARPLDPLVFGLSPRLRGIASHAAAERLLADLPAREAFAAKAGDVAPSIERALGNVFGRARGHLAALYELEVDQLQRVLTALLAAEQRRAPFRVRAVEQRAEITIGPLTLNVRIDRVDELADGTIAIIDYKTGERATSAGWFGARLRDAQVPLYASHAADAVAAAVVTRLGVPETRYSGFWPADCFPGRPAKAAHPDRDEQILSWRRQVELLANEFARGDTRIFVADYDDAARDFAPLTRVFEQLALARGAATQW
jgi:probable DNA repair protein